MYGTLSPGAGREHPDVARLDDGGRFLGEIGEERALLDEVLEELVALILGDVPERGEDLDGDGPLPEDVLRAKNGGETALPDDRFDRVLLCDRRADEAERIGGGRHGGRAYQES